MNKFSIFYPVDNLVITQKFGIENTAKDLIDWYKSMNLLGHNGWDFKAPHGSPVYATHDGYAFYQIDSKGGCGVVIRSDKAYDYHGGSSYFKTIYWHLIDGRDEPEFASPITCMDMNSDGQWVNAGDIIGYVGNTGLSTGDHLHFGIKPQLKDEINGIWYNVGQSNGYMGAIDPEPFFNGYLASNAKSVFTILKSIIGIQKEVINLLQDGSPTHDTSVDSLGTRETDTQTKKSNF